MAGNELALPNAGREWVYADCGVLSAGRVSVGVYPTDAAGQLEYVLRDAGASVLFVEDDEQLDKALEIRARCPGLKWIVVFDTDGLHHFKDPQVIGLVEFEASGKSHDEQNPGELDARLNS